MKIFFLAAAVMGLASVSSAVSPIVHKLELVRSTSVQGANFGTALALNERYLVVGANRDPLFGIDAGVGVGAVFVYDAVSRKLLRTLKPDVVTGSAPAVGMFFGYAVAVSGTRVIVGAPGYGNSAGAVFVYDMAASPNAAAVKLQATGGAAGDYFGISVALEGTTALVGASGRVNQRGAAYLFDVASGFQSWTLTDTTQANSDQMGHAVALSGNLAFVSASFTTGGTVRVYNIRTGDFIVENTPSDPNAVHRFGSDLAVDGLKVVVGDSPNSTGGTERGAIHIGDTLRGLFTRFQITNPVNSDEIGRSVAVSGQLVLAGGPGRSSDEGQAVLFSARGQQLLRLDIADTVAQDFYGYDVALDGSRAVVSAPVKTSARGEAGAGAVYVFEGLAAPLNGDFLANRGSAAAETLATVYGSLGLPTVNQINRAAFTSSLKSSVSGGPTLGCFHDLGSFDFGPMRAAVLNNVDLTGKLGVSFSGTRIATLGQPLMTNDFGTQFLATLNGVGVTSANNTVLISASSTPSVTAVLRTGDTIGTLGGSRLAAIASVVGMEGSTGLRFTLKTGTGDATSDSDTGYYSPSGPNFSREGSPTPAGGGERFGQFDPLISGDLNRRTFSSKVIASDGSITLGAFYKDPSVAPVRFANSSTVPGVPGASFTQLVGVHAPYYRGVITGGGSVTSNNEGIWSSPTGLLLRKGDLIEPRVSVAKIIAFWRVSDSTLMFQAQLSGSGVTGGDNIGLYFREANGTFRRLLRTGFPVAGLHGVTIASLQRVDMNPLSGGYNVLVGLKGSPSGSNQALLTGRLSLGGNDSSSALREPRVLLRKGGLYTTAQGTPVRVSSIGLYSAVRADGVGNPGVGCSTFDYNAAVRIDFSNKTQELWKLSW